MTPKQIERAQKLMNKRDRIQLTIDTLRGDNAYARISVGRRDTDNRDLCLAVPAQGVVAYLVAEVNKLNDQLRALGVEI